MTYCIDSPISIIDDNGLAVKPKGEAELKIIRNTLPKKARSFVRLDDNGFIDKDLLLQYTRKSTNVTNLIELVTSSTIVTFTLADSYIFMNRQGEIDSYPLSYTGFDDMFIDRRINHINGLTTGETGSYGKTLFPDKKGLQNSPSSDIEVYIHPSLSETGAAEAFSHETYGHALLYLRSGGDHDAASHDAVKDREKNKPLRKLILKSRKATIKHMRK